jgi:prepilin-type N-terminal cleavage/methylation domain-containing protein/prepilin-type processing-associated H-X9-DG protein
MRSRAAFTLIELLVVIAIIAILAAILFPVFAQAREKARQTSCLSNMKQMGLALQMYVQDYDEGLPTVKMMGTPGESWLVIVQPYIKSLLLQRCPSDTSTTWTATTPRATSYGFNAYFDPYHPPYGSTTGNTYTLAGINYPSETVFATELAEYTNGDITKPIKADHFMPQFWGSPSRATGMMMGGWDMMKREPTTLAIRRHAGGSNYVFTDGHAKWHRFNQTFAQIPGSAPTRDWYDPQRTTP